jgi:hypothetical protein
LKNLNNYIENNVKITTYNDILDKLSEKEKAYNNLCIDCENKNKEFNVLSDNYERIIDQLNKLRQEYNNNVLELKNINITNDKQKMI